MPTLRHFMVLLAVLISVNGWSKESYVAANANTAFFQATAPVIVGVSNITGTSATIKWNAVAGAAGYTVELYTDAAFSAIVGTPVSGVTGTSYTVTGLTEGTTYYFRVKTSTGTDYGTGSFASSKGYTPLEVTGFTNDVIASGTGVTGGTGTTTNVAATSTDAAVDNADYAYLSRDYKRLPTSGAVTFGLPINRNLPSPVAATPGLIFHMADYGPSVGFSNNSLRVTTAPATLTLVTPMRVSNLYLAVASGGGNTTMTTEVLFSDGTSQTVTGLPVTNWDGAATTAAPAIIQNIGRVSRNSGNTETGNFKLFQVTINIDAANQSKLVSGIKVTRTGAANIVNVFAVSGKLISTCPSLSAVTAAVASATSATLTYNATSFGEGSTSATYTVEVYTDAAMTVPFTGSPFNAAAATTYTVTGLTTNSTYYFKVKASNGTCSSAYSTTSLQIAGCKPAPTSVDGNGITNVKIGSVNNTTGKETNNYGDYSAMAATSWPGAVLPFSITFSTGYAYTTKVWVDWNNDLDFNDAGEEVYAGVSAAPNPSILNGTFTVPAGTALGNYRIRMGGKDGAGITPCYTGTYATLEDYTLTIVPAPAPCIAPAAPVYTLNSTSAGVVTGTFTVSTPAPTGYLVVRSTSPTLIAEPTQNTRYAVGDLLGGGTVVAFNTTPATFTDVAAQNTQHYYFVYAYNDGGATCLGPVYSAQVATPIFTRAAAAQVAATSDIKSTSATINWSSIAVTGGNTPNYSLDVATDAAFTNIVATFSNLTTTSQSVTGLSNATVYYFRVSATTTTGLNDPTYSVGSFTAKNDFTPITINPADFNADVIANGIGLASSSTNNDIDGGNYVYSSRDYKNSPTASYTYGLPVNRTLVNATANPQVPYLLPDYTGNNALRLTALQSGTLNFVTPIKLSSVYISATGGGGNTTISATINFQDGSTPLVVPNIAIPDWFSGNGTVIAGDIGRVNKNNTGQPVDTGNFKIFQVSIPITDPAQQGKFVTGVTFTKTAAANIANIFGVSGRVVGACPTIGTVTAAVASATSATLTYSVSSAGESGSTINYIVEAYTDAAMTLPVTGSPFAQTTATTFTVPGLTAGSTYYFKVKATNGICFSDYATTSLTIAGCKPAPTSVDGDGITNVTIGTINNTTGEEAGNYFDYSAMATSTWASAVVPFSITFSTGFTYNTKIWVDWNNDLDFNDAGEEVYVGESGQPNPSTLRGTFTVPAGIALGNYRMRIGGIDSGTITPCYTGAYGTFEDYTLNIVPAPAPCVAPDAPTFALSGVTASSITGTVTAPATAPTGYLVIRSTSATLTAQPTLAAIYAVGANVGGGTVVAVGTTAPTFTQFLPANTKYYYFAYAYNDGGATCLGPVYSTPATADATTCAVATVAATASNVTNTTATVNWSSIVGTSGEAATYTVEVYTDAALTALLGSYTSATNSYALTGLTNGTMYYYRVKGSTAGCSDASWSATSSFTAQNNFTPFSLTGFNADVIANGSGLASTSTTNSIDAVDNAYMSLDYRANATSAAGTFGLPLNRTVQGSEFGLKFMFEDYSLNNSLRLAAQNQQGELTLATPAKVSDLYFAVTSGSGTATVSAEVQFTDNTTQAATSFSVINWDDNSTPASPGVAINIGRVNRNDNNGTPNAGNFKVFQLSLPILEANQAKTVRSIKFTKTSAGATEPVAHIFAISGKLINVCPVLDETTATATATGAEVSWTQSSAGDGGAVSYTVSVYTDAAMTVPVTGSPFTATNGSPYTVTGLTPSTTYYYQVKATNSVCSSAVLTGTFTTVCTPLATPVTAAQTVCAGSTIANLVVTGTGTAPAFTWYTSATGTTTVNPSTVLVQGSYFVAQTEGPCASNRVEVAVTVTALPTAPVVDATRTVCQGSTVADLNATGANGATLTWYATENGTPLTSSDVLAAGTYYVTQTVGACTSAVAQTVVTVNALPLAPTADAVQTFCAGSKVSDLVAAFATDATYSWYAANSGTPLQLTDGLAAGSYSVTQTLNGCTSAPTSVTVVINTVPVPTVSNQAFCDVATASELVATGVATGATVNWFNPAGEPLTDTTSITSGTYSVSQTVDGCTSAVAKFIVTLTPTPDAPTGAATQDFVDGETLEDIELTTLPGATIQWYTKSAEGDFTAVPSTTVLVDDVTYYATQMLFTCESVNFAVTVNKVLSTDRFTFSNLVVYPNPVVDVLTVSNTAAITKVVVINLIGQTVLERKANDTSVQINTAALQAGPYILQVHSNDNFTTVKFIKK